MYIYQILLVIDTHCSVKYKCLHDIAIIIPKFRVLRLPCIFVFQYNGHKLC